MVLRLFEVFMHLFVVLCLFVSFCVLSGHFVSLVVVYLFEVIVLSGCFVSN